MFDQEIDDEVIDTLSSRLQNLEYYLKLKDLGYDVQDWLFAYCGCGECTNDPFLGSVIMLIFDIEHNSGVQFERHDFEFWVEDHPELKDNQETECVLEVFVQDDNADTQLIPVILDSYQGVCNILKIDVLQWATGPAWHVALDGWDSGEDYDICNFFLHIKQVTTSGEVAA